MTTQNQTHINELPDIERLKIYDFLMSGCTHLYSKNKLQKEKFEQISAAFAKLAKDDPYFLAHLTAYAAKQDSKDLQVLTVFFNSLNDANGQPFFPGSKKNKPNLRNVSAALLQSMSPHLALRVLELTRSKFQVKDYLAFGAHYSTMLKSAFRKYLLYRENNLDMVKGIKRNAMGKKYIQMYKLLHMLPTLETASILNWKQRGRKIEKLEKIDFSNKTSAEIAKEIKDKKLSPLIALSAIPSERMNFEVAKALLTNSTGNQAIILQNMFRTKGFLEIDEIKDLFNKKVKTAKTAIDRIDTLTKDQTDEEKKEMAKVRSKVRKEQMGDIGKIYLHIDASSSMSQAIEFAKNNAAVIAECVNDPKTNFRWGYFNSNGYELKVPDEFTKEDFHANLYGVRASGMTDCIALYEKARKFGADVDIYITDQGHNVGAIQKRINQMTEKGLPKPKAAVIINFGGNSETRLKHDLEAVGIPVEIMGPNAIKESALVAQAIQTAIKGKLAIIEKIMETELPALPKWWNDKTLEVTYKERL